jgi:MFS transporter, putative metabolite transport protein
MALDVCHSDHSRDPGDDRTVLHHREPQLAIRTWSSGESQVAVTKLLIRTPQYPSSISLARHTRDVTQAKPSFWALFDRRNLRATIFASVPWFLQDLGTYGIGIFAPTILAAALGGGPDHIRSVSDLIADGILAAKGAALITTLLIVGVAFAVVLADSLGRIKLQIGGFDGKTPLVMASP